MVSSFETQDIDITGKIQLNKLTRNSLLKSGLYTEESLKGLKSISVEQIIHRRMSVLYQSTNGLTLDQFVNDAKFQIFFGTKDRERMSKFFEIIGRTKPDQIAKIGDLSTLINMKPNEVMAFKPASFSTKEAELLQGFFAQFFEREIGPMLYLKGSHTLPLYRFNFPKYWIHIRNRSHT